MVAIEWFCVLKLTAIFVIFEATYEYEKYNLKKPKYISTRFDNIKSKDADI